MTTSRVMTSSPSPAAAADLSRQSSIYSLIDPARSLGSMSVDDLHNIYVDAASPRPSVAGDPAVILHRAVYGCTFKDVGCEITDSGPEQDPIAAAAGEMTLEDFSARAVREEDVRGIFVAADPAKMFEEGNIGGDGRKRVAGESVVDKVVMQRQKRMIKNRESSARSRERKQITRQSRKNVCFVIFLDEDTLNALLSEGQQVDSGGFIGLWKIVVVKNLPYTDMRRVGKIPKFLTHRLFPSARYSIWLDSKLRLQTDPYLILEYFLWRRGYEYAISNHYDRHCVSEEVVQNKKLNKFNHTVIDQQFQFYQSDGLKKFDPSDPKKLLPSYVPEGSFIVRAHTPMSNLFSCLWFNEVDRFTPRDQLSFAYTYLKLRRMNPLKPFYLNMFKDCERRSMAKLFRHRAEEKRTTPK